MNWNIFHYKEILLLFSQIPTSQLAKPLSVHKLVTCPLNACTHTESLFLQEKIKIEPKTGSIKNFFIIQIS